MKRVALVDREILELQDVPIPEVTADSVLIKVAKAGICGSDIHFYHGEYNGTIFPLVLGHEFAGYICQIGENVTGLKIGDRVTAEPGIGCGKCPLCKAGAYNLCRSQDFIGGRPGFPGGFAEYISVPASMVIPIPGSIDITAACMVEPVAVAMHCLKRGRVSSGDTVLIIGSGAIGILVSQAVRYGGASKIIMSDVSPERLALAKKFGADDVINSSEVDLESYMLDTYGEAAIDVVYDAASVGPTFKQAINVVKSGGRVVNIGEATKDVLFERNLLGREIEITGSRQYTREDFIDALKIITEHGVNLELVPIKKFSLTQYEDAFNTAMMDKSIMRVMFAIADN